LRLQCADHGSGSCDWQWGPALHNIVVLLFL